MSNIPLPIKGACHCGAVSYEMSAAPRWAVSCNCSICRRLGAIWGHGSADEIKFVFDPDATLTYSRLEKVLAFHTCKTCGSTTHWEGIAGDALGRMAVNLTLTDPGTIEKIGKRHFDGADTWAFLD